MRTIIIFNLLVYGLIAFGAKSLLKNNGKTVVEQGVPKPVLTAFTKSYPDAVVYKYRKDKKYGKRVYEISFTQTGKKLEARYAQNGLLLKIEETISTDSLPGDIKMEIAKSFQQPEIEKAAKVIKEGKLYYDVKLSCDAKDLQGKRALRFSGDARLLTKI